MNCPVCKHDDSKVIGTRGQGEYRRRECLRCHSRWSTVEIPAGRKEALERVEKAVLAAAVELQG